MWIRSLQRLVFIYPLTILAMPLSQKLADPKYNWMDQVVENQVKPFKRPCIKKRDLDRLMRGKNHQFERYKVINNQVIGDGRVKKTLEVLCENFLMPDLDFIYHRADGPTTQTQLPQKTPIFFSGTRQNKLKKVFLLHDSSFHLQDKSGYDWLHIMNLVEESERLLDWDKKKNAVVWRGANTGPFEVYNKENWRFLTRGRLVHLSLQYPKKINARFSKLIPWKTVELEDFKGCIPSLDSLTIEEQLHYKYQICMDGETCTHPGYRWRLLSNCVTLKPDSSLEMYFYPALTPYKHYVPVNNDLSDLVDKISWLDDNPDQAKLIADHSTKFVRENLDEEATYIYCYKILCAYAKLLTFQPSI